MVRSRENDRLDRAAQRVQKRMDGAKHEANECMGDGDRRA